KEVYSLFPELGYFVLPENPQRLKEKYEMHIYTMGTRSYAERVAKLVDPNHEYFQERILSRDESGSITHKSIKRLFPCDDSMVVVIDDRGDIWQWSDNLVKVRPYSFFGGVGDINAVRTNNNSENAVRVDDDKTEKKNNDVQLEQVEKLTREKLIVDRDAELENLLNVLERIHSSFYRDEDKVGSLPVSLIMNSFKSQALKGARIVFSGIFSSGIDGRQTELWKMTEQFGAICVSSGVVDETTTHVVVSNTIISQTSITEKVRRAKQISLDIQLEQKEQKDDQNTKPKKSIVAVVNLNWLHQVFSKWEWVDERPFLLFNYNTDSNLNNNNSNATVVVPFDIKDQLASSISSITLSQLEIEGQNTAGYTIQTEIDTGVAGSDNQSNAKEAVQIESLVDHVDWAEVDRELNELSDFDQSDGSDSEHTSGENENETENEDEDEDEDEDGIDEENEENEENEEKEVEDVEKVKTLYSADYVDDLLPNGKRPKLLSDPLTDLKTNVLTNDSDSKDNNGDENIDSVDEFDDEEFADLIRDIDHETSLD
ncbi:RNA polymerase II subunit A C-terminal domain phosphatase, partial [Zancudomyces culisetae]